MSKEEKYDLLKDLEEPFEFKGEAVSETVDGVTFYKNDSTQKIWWVESEVMDDFRFSFDKKIIFNLFKDYPKKLNKEQKEIFDKENPYWADFFKDRKKEDRN